MNISDDCVSVVITCYNQGRFLSEAIDSVLHQTHAQLELIVVDDGATDCTKSVAQTYSEVRYIYQSNQGASLARNAGIRESRGAYLTFLDADDRLLPNALAAGLDCFHRYPSCGFVVGRYSNIATDGSPISGPNRPSGAQDFYSELLRGNVIGMHATVLYRRAVLEHVSGFDPRFRGTEDYEIALRIARTFSVVEHDSPIAEYRRHDQNMSLDYPFMLRASLSALREQWPYVKEKPQYKPALIAGMANWRRHYALRMSDDLRTRFETSGLTREVLQRSLNIVRIYPQALGSGVLAAMRAVTQRINRPPSKGKRGSAG